MFDYQLPAHGGNLRWAAQQFNIPYDEWLDLSTGINPNGWPVPQLSPECWLRLPQEQDGLEATAAQYYGSDKLLPVAGSQAAISTLPKLRQPSRVGVISPGYAEHARAWRGAGHEVVALDAADIESELEQLDVLVVINPNNPTGGVIPVLQLNRWLLELQNRGGWLVIDEAFIDTTPEQSMIDQVGSEGLIVLRSLGKFFGLAGVRVGFLFGWNQLLEELRDELDPWSVSGPAREVARRALEDRQWQRVNSQQLQNSGQRLASLLQSHGIHPSGGTSLFQYCITPAADRLFHLLAEQGVLVRYFADPKALRFGLPALMEGGESMWQRLDTVLENINPQEYRAIS